MRARARTTAEDIIGTLETCNGVSETEPHGFGRDAHGRITFEHAGTTRTWAEEQRTIERDGSPVFLDAQGNEFKSDEIELYEVATNGEQPAAEPRERTRENERHPKGADAESHRAAPAHRSRANPTMVVTLEGGLVVDVKFPPELIGRLNVRVEDIDTEGLDDDRLETDADGRQYCLTTWP